jgi:hypothetical protein
MLVVTAICLSYLLMLLAISHDICLTALWRKRAVDVHLAQGSQSWGRHGVEHLAPTSLRST